MVIQQFLLITITAANQPLSATRLNCDSFTVYTRPGNTSSVRLAPLAFNTTNQTFTPLTVPLTDSTAMVIPQNQSRTMTNLSDVARRGERYDLSKYVVNGTANDLLEVVYDIVAPGV